MEVNREQIKHLCGEEVFFQGKFIKYGSKTQGEYKVVTMLFREIYVNGIYIDHMWVTDSKRMRKKNIKEGSTVSFSGIVISYYRGYKVENERHIKIVKEGRGKNLNQFVTKKAKYWDWKIAPFYENCILQSDQLAI